MKLTIRLMTRAAVIAAAYVVLTLPLAQFAFGPIQLRLAEALTALAALTPAAIPGLFMGCLLANILNPQNLGPVDIIGGSLATLTAAWMTWRLRIALTGREPAETGKPGRKDPSGRFDWRRFSKKVLMLTPPVVVNALVVGFYLPFIIPGQVVSAGLVAGTMLSIFISQSLAVYLLGLPLLLALEKANPAILED